MTGSPAPARQPSVAVILPAYNEADRISRTLESIARYAARTGRITDVVVADDGSRDDTVPVAEAAASRAGLPIAVLRLPHRGKALTVRSAMLDVAGRSSADYLMMLDADDELPIDQLDHVDWSPDPTTIYIGRRTGVAPPDAPRPSPFRRVMSAGMRAASRLLLGIAFPDTQCGFKLFPRKVVPALFRQQRSSGWTFDAELLLIAHRISGLPVVEVPVTWTPRGVSKVGPGAAISSVWSLLQTWLRRLIGVYRPISGLRRAT